jgi:uroporphyrinogen III methyltransferase/synthase
MEQEDINRLIVEKARENNRVVRLKGGDPYIFGRGGEEALFCAENGVEFEVVNGISSAYAVPAYAGIPVTNRGHSSSVAFITGHEDPAKLESDIMWDKIATGIQTLVFLMGVKNLPFIIKKLSQHGLGPSTPAAVIENGCTPKQRTVSGTLSDISEKVNRAGIKPPSIIIVGKVVSLREKINWFESRPLFGKTIVVTRSREQASELSAQLMERGAGVIEIPVIKIMPPHDIDIIKNRIIKTDAYDWIIFTSVYGVSYYFKYLLESGFDSRKLASVNICAIGSSTADALREHGITPDMIPDKFTSCDITRELVQKGEVRGKSFLLPRADIAPKEMADALIHEGAKQVDEVAVYRNVEEDMSGMTEQVQALKDGKFDLVTFTSSSTVKNFDRLAGAIGMSNKEKIRCAVIGPITAGTATDLGYSVEISSEEHTIEGLVEAIFAYYQ